MFAALLLRALVPPGIMVQPGANGGMAAMLCPSDRTFAALLAAAEAEPAGHHALAPETHHAGAHHGADISAQGKAPPGEHPGSHDGHDADAGEPPAPCTFAAHQSVATDPGAGLVLPLPHAGVIAAAGMDAPLSPASRPLLPPARAPPVPA